jgi:hypothetical protein
MGAHPFRFLFGERVGYLTSALTEPHRRVPCLPKSRAFFLAQTNRMRWERTPLTRPNPKLGAISWKLEATIVTGKRCICRGK